jgi:2-polyprenyl-3-methyl-5-hydroxy-6-metoxy-1,4-benzoquinol methylase
VTSEPPATSREDYADRLLRLETKGWKRALDVQRPYRWNLQRQELGRTLDVGCGIGRNLAALPADSLGVDHNAQSVELARKRGYRAVTVEQFTAEPPAPGSFDSMLLAHVVEHMTAEDAEQLLRFYLPYVRPGGRVMLICPQRRGFATDDTHVQFFDLPALRALATSVGLVVTREYSFPLPERAGRFFAYNEYCLIAARPANR